MNPQQPGAVDPLTGQPSRPFVPVPPVDPAANPGMVPVGPAVYPPAASPQNNKFGGFGSNDPTGPAVTPAGAPPTPAFPIPTPGQADRAVSPPFPDVQPGFADRPALIPSTTTETSTQTSGPDAATTANINAATTDANKAAAAAGAAKVGELNATAGFERGEAQAQYGRGVNNYFTRAGEMQTQDEVIRETTSALENAAKFKPDRTALFHGDTGALFGISAAVAAMAGGWLMGQGLTGGKNPYLETVMRMIDDNANDQIQANSQVYQELTRRLGDAKAARAELKARMYEAVNSTIEAQSRFNKAQLVQQGAAGVMAEMQKETARNRLEAAKLTGQTKTKTVQSRTQMVPTGVDVTDPREYARVGKVGGLDRLANEVDSLAESGILADNVGLISGVAAGVGNAVTADAFRSPERARVDKARAQWELMQRADWASEPNGQAVQERLSSIAFPKNSAEIPLFRQSVREALNAADPGGKYRLAGRAMGQTPPTVSRREIPVVR